MSAEIIDIAATAPRRWRLGPMTLALLVAAVIALAIAAGLVTWAFTAAPAGSAGLDRELAAAAAWPDTDVAASAAAGTTALRLIAQWRAVTDAAAEGFPDEMHAYRLLSTDLADADDEGRWPDVRLSEQMMGRRGTALPRAMLDARVAAHRASDVLDRLGAIVDGPRPSFNAATLAGFGYGTANPFSVVLEDVDDAMTIAAELHVVMGADLAAGSTSSVIRTLRAWEGLARIAEAVPTLLGHLAAASIRETAWERLVDLAHDGHLKPATIDAVLTETAAGNDDVPLADRWQRTIDAELTLLAAGLGHMHDKDGRPLPATWGWLMPPPGNTAPRQLSRWTNLLGLVLPRQSTTEQRLRDIAAGTAPPPAPPTSLTAALLDPDTLPSLLMPDIQVAHYRLAIVDARIHVARVALAIARYEQRTGHPPVSLAALGLPAAATQDPSAGGDLGYAVLAAPLGGAGAGRGSAVTHRWRVWAFGVDGRNDGGHAYDDVVMPQPHRTW